MENWLRLQDTPKKSCTDKSPKNGIRPMVYSSVHNVHLKRIMNVENLTYVNVAISSIKRWILANQWFAIMFCRFCATVALEIKNKKKMWSPDSNHPKTYWLSYRISVESKTNVKLIKICMFVSNVHLMLRCLKTSLIM